MFTNFTSLVIPTRNRLVNLYNTLSRLKEFKLKFLEIIVVDSSDKFTKEIRKICRIFNVKLYFSRPSSALQRNIGLSKISKKSKYVMFLDDDIIFFKNSFSKMNYAIKKYGSINSKIAGYGFNHIEINKYDYISFLKKSAISRMLNLYSNHAGKVKKNGWHTKINNLKKDTFVEWLHTAATIYDLKKIKKILFDESFGRYSYLEDLDFSYRVSSNFKLILVAQAKFLHPNNISREGLYFGELEILNRYKFVKKNNLNIKLFYLSSIIRFLISLFGLFRFNLKSISRATGNVIAISKCLIFKKII
jgi:glycosyltransferase involved in cell wall biosynthesis